MSELQEEKKDPRTGEQIYDEEIAPALMQIAEKIKALGMSMVAVVEYAPNERGDTTVMGGVSGLEMHMVYMCAKTVPNVDSYILNLKRFCYQRNIDTSTSMVLKS